MHGVRPTRCFKQLSAFNSEHAPRRAARSVSNVSIVHCFTSNSFDIMRPAVDVWWSDVVESRVVE